MMILQGLLVSSIFSPELSFHIITINFSDIQTQQESIWVLINVAFGSNENVRAVIGAGAVPKLIRLLKSEDKTIVRNSTWALANMCGDGTETCNHLINEGIIVELVRLLAIAGQTKDILRLISWLALNLSRHVPIPLSKLQPLFDPLLGILETDRDKRITIDTCTFFTNVLESFGFVTNATVQKILTCISKVLARPEMFAIESSLKIIIVVAKSSSLSIRELIFQVEIATRLLELTTHQNHTASQLSLQIFRFLTSGTFSVTYIQQILQLNPFENVSKVFGDSHYSVKSKREAVGLLKGIVLKGITAQSRKMFNDEHIELWIGFCELFKSKSYVLVIEALKFLVCVENHLLTQNISDQIQSFGILEALNELLDHINDEISSLSYQLLESFDYQDLPYHHEMFGPAEE